MTGILTPLFEGKEVRLIEQTGELWIPLADIVSAWGIDRSTPDNMINRNAEVFAGLVTTVLDAASTPMTAINERGLYLMMGKITTGRVKNKSAREAIIRFQRWFPELIQKYRKGEIVQAAPDLRTELQEAKDLAALCDRPADSFLAVVFRKHGRKDLADALTQPVPPTPGPSQPGIWMIPQDIGKKCDLSGLFITDMHVCPILERQRRAAAGGFVPASQVRTDPLTGGTYTIPPPMKISKTMLTVTEAEDLAATFISRSGFLTAKEQEQIDELVRAQYEGIRSRSDFLKVAGNWFLAQTEGE